MGFLGERIEAVKEYGFGRFFAEVVADSLHSEAVKSAKVKKAAIKTASTNDGKLFCL